MVEEAKEGGRFWRWLVNLFANRRRRRGLWAIQFVPTNIKDVDAELEITRRAREQGAAGFPTIMDTQPDFVHQLVFHHFHQKIADLHTSVQPLARHYDGQFSQLGIERIPDQVRSAADRFQQLAGSALISFRARLEEARERRDNAKKEYETFKKSYGLVSDADYPESKTAYYAIPFFVMAFEAGLNSFLFSGADPTGSGMAGGIRIALIIALINVVLAVMIGNALRNLNSKDLLRKALGGLAACAALLYVPLNLFWAHYRDRAIALKNLDSFSFVELIKLRMQVLPHAWKEFVDNPLFIKSIESWGLFVLGCVIVIFALIDGYKMSDPVPGYEDRHRALRRAQSALGILHDECVRLIQGAFGTITRELAAAERSFKGLLASHDSYLAAQKNLETVFKNQARDYVQSYETSIALYRDENRVKREGAPLPQYFNRPPEGLRVPAFPANVQLREERSVELRAYVEKIDADVAAAHVAMQERQNAALRDIGVIAAKATSAD